MCSANKCFICFFLKFIVYVIFFLFNTLYPKFYVSSIVFQPALFLRKIPSHVQVGFSHSNILRTVIHRACSRFPNLASNNSLSSHLPSKSNAAHLTKALNKREGCCKVFVIFGGDTSERQVSLMSGTNVWLNLLGFDDVSLRNLGYVLVCFTCWLIDSKF